MVLTIWEIRKIFGEFKFCKYDPTAHYRMRRGWLRDNQIAYPGFPHNGLGKSVDLLIDMAAGYKIFKYVQIWSEEKNIDTGIDFNTFFKELEDLFMDSFYKIGEHVAKHTSHENIKNGDYIREKQIVDLIKSGSNIRADVKFMIFKAKFEPLIKECKFPGCGQMFLAGRKDSMYCDKCRAKAHVYKSPSRRKKTLDPIRCEHCNELFTPKTKRARFCKDVCRVRAGREKIKI